MKASNRLADAISKLAAVFVAPPAPAHTAPTEDDLASERFFQRVNRDRGIVTAQPGQPRRAAE